MAVRCAQISDETIECFLDNCLCHRVCFEYYQNSMLRTDRQEFLNCLYVVTQFSKTDRQECLSYYQPPPAPPPPKPPPPPNPPPKPPPPPPNPPPPHPLPEPPQPPRLPLLSSEPSK